MLYTRAVIYTRVSTKSQADTMSLRQQLKDCQTFARSRGWQVVKVYSETCSAFKSKQPQLQQLIHDLRAGTAVLVNSMDRFSRNMNNGTQWLKTIERKRCGVVSMRNEPNPIEAIRMAEAESTMMRNRQLERAKFVRSAGGHVGAAPYGSYRTPIKNDKLDLGMFNMMKISVDPYELEAISLIKLLTGPNATTDEVRSQIQIINGPDYDVSDVVIADTNGQGFHYENIAVFLNAYNITKRGKKWSAEMVAKVDQEN